MVDEIKTHGSAIKGTPKYSALSIHKEKTENTSEIFTSQNKARNYKFLSTRRLRARNIKFMTVDNKDTTKSVFRHFKSSQMRKSMHTIFSGVTSTATSVVVDIRNRPSVIIADYDHYLNLLNNKSSCYEEQLATLIVDKLLKDAPLHIREPRIKELEVLTISKLKALLDVIKLPISHNKRRTIINAVGKDIIQKLERSKKIADMIIKAEKDGIYDQAEHSTGNLNLN
jgi:hypothetical protein